MSLKNKIAYSITVLACFCFTVAAFAATSPNEVTPQPPKEPIIVNGDDVEYFQDKKMVVGSGNVSIKYKDIELTCDKITVYLDTREAIAEGNVRVTQQGAYFTGERMNYNFDTKKGTVLKGYVNAKPFYGKADEVSKVERKDEFKLNEGYVTTCDLEKPHYRLRAKQVEVYLGDKVVAKHIFTYIGNVPVLYWPYYVQPLKERKSHITVIPGQQKDWGYYALTAYRYYISDTSKGDILLDYRTKKGLAEGLNHYYDTGKIGDGAVKFYFTRENEFVYEKTGAVRDRWRWQIRHEWDLPEETDTKMLFEFNTMSDRDMVKDFIYNEYEELGATPDNYLTFITQKKDFSTQFLIRKRFDKFLDVVERLPEYSITVPDNNIIKGLPVYYRMNASAAYLNHTYDNSIAADGLKDVGSGRIDMYNRLSYAMNFFRSLSITPYAGIEDTYYSRITGGRTNQVRNIFSAGITNSVKFYKIYNAETNFLGLDINKLRHIITPTADYYYTHKPSITPNKLPSFDSVDAINKSNGVLLGLENRLQTKRSDGAGGTTSVDVATLRVTTDYAFILKSGEVFDSKQAMFRSIDFDLELIPYSWGYLKAAMSVDPKRYWIQNESIDIVANWKDRWSLAICNRYEHILSGQSSLVTLDGTYKINDKWKIRAYERFNTYDVAFEEQAYNITRDLHCWIAE
ncbi:MAG: LPS export ABC transporter periplasmic protein LptC, partial [Candidatus Omnitrophica bacterium]|nr:LPS export ABC transporter periplasmic protein LptC [Candidatus Omnitrophota bacterium]